MTSSVSYDVIRIKDLEPSDGVLDGDAEIIFNDLRESPPETKKTNLVNLGNSLKQYLLPIASSSVLGGIMVGNKLSIVAATGLLNVDIDRLTDLDDVKIIDESRRVGDVLVWSNDDHWENKAIPMAYYEYKGGDGIEVVPRTNNTDLIDINFNLGLGLELTNQNDVNVNTGDGLRINNGTVAVDVGNGLSIRSSNKKLDVNVQTPLRISAGKVQLNYGNGLTLQNDALVLDTSKVVVLDANGNLQLPNNLTVIGGLQVYQNLTVQKDLQIGGVVRNELTIDGDCTVNQNADIRGSLTVDKEFEVLGAATFRNNISVQGETVLGRTLQVSGVINALDNIRAANGEIFAKSLEISDSINTKSLVASAEITAKDYETLSDERLKKNVEIIDDALYKLKTIKGVTFDWKLDDKKSAGVIAQDVQRTLPELVVGGNARLSVNYNGLIGLLVQAVKELSKEVEELKNK